MKPSNIIAAFLVATGAFALPARRQSVPRPMKNLGRDITAMRSSSNTTFVSWRLLGLDPDGIGFNVCRSINGANATRLNSEVLTKRTDYVDSTANLAQSNSFTLPANNAQEPVVRVPLKASGRIEYVWVGDFDADGEYDYLIDRHGTQEGLEAYRRDGKFLWSVKLEPNSENQNNIEPGSPGIDVGHWDGVTLYDVDGDGIAEVIVRIANGVVFGDGKLPLIFRIDKYGAINPGDSDPGFLGDVFGNWREEVITTNAAYDKLISFTTDQLTSADYTH
ncbi:hypothetical protein E8E11_001300 [Didymella keratinophila]|nr:hypothetical protein E8E11_001300 [Didymella keratinophila]